MKIVFATNNEHKLREVRQILDGRYEVLSLNDIGCHADIPETADTLDGNALQKARFVHERYGIDVFADDTGLEVDALGGEPGVRTARYAGEAHDTNANVDLLLRNMEDKDDRRARFRTAIALIRDGVETLFEGKVEGEITRQREGDNGFGYDPVFRPEGYDKTFAELGVEVKNTISHRARAVSRLVEFLSCMLVCFFSLTATAQQVGKWTFYPSYADAKTVISADKALWTVASGNLWTMDTTTGEITTFDRTRGLNGVEIAQIAYSKETKRLLVFYDDANIDIIDAQTYEVYNIPHLVTYDYPKKDANDIFMYGREAWVATDFGILRIDMAEAIIRETYKREGGVASVCISDMTPNVAGKQIPSEPTLFCATASGIYYASLKANLLDQSLYKQLNSPSYRHLVWWKGFLIAFTQSGTPQQIDINSGVGNNLVPRNVRCRFEWNDNLICVGEHAIYSLDKALNSTVMLETERAESAAAVNKTFYIAARRTGVIPYQCDGTTLSGEGSPIRINSPVTKKVYRLRYAGKRLLVTYGADALGQFEDAGADYMEDGIWTNFEMQHFRTDNRFACVTDIVEDPNDDNHHFISTQGHGILEYRGTKMVNHYDATNSPLRAPNSILDSYTWVTALAYDADGNLWMGNSHVDSTFVCLTPKGQWLKRYDRNTTKMQFVSGMEFDGDYMWSPVWSWNDGTAFYGVDTRGTFTRTSDDRTKIVLNTVEQQDGSRYSMGVTYAAAIDRDHQVWFGCNAGLFVVTDLAEYFQSGFKFHQIKVNRNDGSGLADYLLNGIACTAIAVDGADRKWIGTDGQGVFLVSPDGQEEIFHFTTENSPLPTDKIKAIAVSKLTGEVAIGTEMGLLTFVSDAVSPASELDADNIVCYPNPVPPNYHGTINIKGLTMNSEVKIATVTGQVIFRTHSNGGMATWNGCDGRGHRVATGVYNVIVSTEDGSEAEVTRIVVTN